MINDKDKDIYGIWDVSTYADCEGKSSKKLGCYSGTINQLTKELKHLAIYVLMFQPKDNWENEINVFVGG